MHKKNLGMLLVLAFLAGSCSKVAFETQTSNNGGVTPDGDPQTASSPTPTPTPTPGPAGAISCSTYFNANLSSVNVTSTATNPTVNAVCTPTNVTLSWVVRNAANAPVTINGLQGAQSIGDFYAAGAGTYQVTVKATAPSYTDFTSAPITATVTVPGPPPVTRITCDVKINGQYAAVDVRAVGANPRVTADCVPATGSAYVWTVLMNGATVTVPNLAGSDSIPDFLSMNPGTYDMYLHVSQTGYLPYDSVTPLTVKVTPPPAGLKPMNFATTVTPQNNQLDLLLIVDDSNSMAADNKKLADKMKGLTDSLTAAGFDWQMCATVTRPLHISTTDPNLYWGASIFWTGNTNTPAYILKPTTANVAKVYSDTLNTAIGSAQPGSEDERPIKAAWWHIYNGNPASNGNSGCYRKDAGLAVVMISNEDERSIGGDISQKYYSNEYFALENDDLPNTLMLQVHNVFGNGKRFSYNSIIVRPGDTACMAAQDAIGTKSHYGVQTAQMANLSGGYIGSICDSDYTQNLNYFKNQIALSMKTFTLDCAPVGAITVNVTPAMTYTYSVSGTNVIFDPALPVGKNVSINYNCVP